MAAEAPGPPCAVESVERGESLWATASRVERWLLVEQPGAWGPDALLESGLDPVVARLLEASGRRHGVRVVLLRRQGPRPALRTVFVAHTGRRGGWAERLEVETPRDLLAIDLAALAEPVPPGMGVPAGAVHLVCTNGRHDRCCAEFGRPVARALQSAGVPEVWECSHIGGDRFAANVVCLPTGVYFGRVPPAGAAGMAAGLARGVVDLDHYRGRSCYQPMVQAAEIFVRRELAESRLGALAPGRSEPAGPGRRTVEVAAWDGRTARVTVARHRAPLRRLTCRAEDEVEPWRYELVALEWRAGGRSWSP